MKLVQNVHLQALSNLHERYIDRFTKRSYVCLRHTGPDSRDRTRGLDR